MDNRIIIAPWQGGYQWEVIDDLGGIVEIGWAATEGKAREQAEHVVKREDVGYEP